MKKKKIQVRSPYTENTNDFDQTSHMEVKSKHIPFVFNCFSKEQIKEINIKIHNEFLTEKENPSLAAASVNKKGKFYHVPFLPMGELLHRWMWNCQRINQEVFGYDLYWNFAIDRMNYNIYEVGDEYGWHTDESTEWASDMKLTCLLNLSEEPYEGGEFHTITFGENSRMKFEPGMGMVCPSVLAHKVSPITEGKRTTLTYWALGPAWK